MKRILLPICTLAVALVGAGLASATPISTPGLTLTSGSLTFTNFNCVFTGTGISGGSCASIDVAALTPQPAGIQFSTSMSVIGVAPSSTADAALQFSVTDPNGISVVGLSFNSTFMGMDVNTVTEDVYTDSTLTDLVGTAVVSCGVTTGCAATTTTSVALDGTFTNLFITKDVSLIAGAGGSGSTSIITQTFDAPEPMSVALMGSGFLLVGLVGLRRKLASNPTV